MTAAPMPEPARRSQRERKEASVARLIGATVESILEVGYSRTSVGEICRRAQISKGGMFRHFDTRLDVVVAAADFVADRHLEQFQTIVVDRDDIDLATALSMMRDRHRDASNVVWFELLVAARTDDELRARMVPVTLRFHRAMDALARLLPPLARLTDDERHLLVSLARNHFDGETIARAVVAEPVVEDARLALLVGLGATALGNVTSTR